MSGVLSRVCNALGSPPNGWAAAFPLSPSMQRADWAKEGGVCALRHILGSAYGWVPRMGHDVYRGQLFDRVLTWGLNLRRAGETPLVDGAVAELYVQHDRLQKQYDLSRVDVPIKAWLFQIENLIRAFWANIFPRFNPLLVQQKHWLWIGDGERPSAQPERGDPNWVTGRSDWVEKRPDGLEVHDMKVMSKMLGRGNKKFTAQLATYCASLEQDGSSVAGFVLDMLDWKTSAYDADPTLWTSALRDRVIFIYRAMRDHYLGALGSKSELLIPIQGNGECSARGCNFYQSCPFGLGKPWRGEQRGSALEV